ncbi:MAG: HEAT repeat domain-containing protein [Deltaproteobacteria bacterium]|nr:HEAT repeat domain-containing protein [Deltaproteobacteria bacterium]
MPSRTKPVNHASRLARATSVALVVALLVIRATTAWADNVTELAKQLENGSDYKVRLSAALSLSKLGDQRAVPAFIAALDDSDKTVRGAAAVGLSKLINAKTKEKLRKQAIDALTRVAKSDASTFVQKQAEKALETIQGLTGGAATAPALYVNVGEMSVKAPGADKTADKLKTLMKSTVEKTVKKVDKSMSTTWPGGTAPTEKQLGSTKGFFVDGTLNELTVKTKGASSIVSCKLSMLVATYPRKSIFGVLEGSASVQGSDDPKDIEFAKGDCIAAVIEDLVAKKIVPTIQTRSGTP